MSDFMELGDSGLVPQEDGSFLDTKTGNIVDEDGRVFSPEGEKIYDPDFDVEDHE